MYRSGLYCSLIAPLQGGRQLALQRFRGLALDQFANQIKAVLRQLAVILADGIHRDRQRIVEIVIVKTG